MINVPEFLDPTLTTKLFDTVGKTFSYSAKTAIVAIVTFYRLLLSVLRPFLNELLGMVTHFQNMVYLPLGKFKFPAVSILLLNEVISVTTFDMFPTDDWYPAWFDLPNSAPYNR
jgi:hypothetical protein